MSLGKIAFRRFGKSVLVDTLESYFLGKKELFEGLKIMQLETKVKMIAKCLASLQDCYSRKRGPFSHMKS